MNISRSRLAVRRLRRRWLFFAHFLLSILLGVAAWLLTYQWFYEHINYDIEGFTYGIGSSFYNARIISLWLIIGVILIAHFFYFLYQANLDHVLQEQAEADAAAAEEKPKRVAELTDDGELILEDEADDLSSMTRRHKAST